MAQGRMLKRKHARSTNENVRPMRVVVDLLGPAGFGRASETLPVRQGSLQRPNSGPLGRLCLSANSQNNQMGTSPLLRWTQRPMAQDTRIAQTQASTMPYRRTKNDIKTAQETANASCVDEIVLGPWAGMRSFGRDSDTSETLGDRDPWRIHAARYGRTQRPKGRETRENANTTQERHHVGQWPWRMCAIHRPKARGPEDMGDRVTHGCREFLGPMRNLATIAHATHRPRGRESSAQGAQPTHYEACACASHHAPRRWNRWLRAAAKCIDNSLRKYARRTTTYVGRCRRRRFEPRTAKCVCCVRMKTTRCAAEAATSESTARESSRNEALAFLV